MPRNPRLRDWPERLKRLTVDELRQARAYWEPMVRILGHPQARKGATNTSGMSKKNWICENSKFNAVVLKRLRDVNSRP
ncbi:MAG TPA: hypothetical protein VHU84_18695 [Lacipirellulaceae bacterium]|nr:hypothetical protein [Lacipirellulaceae bacterium]